MVIETLCSSSGHFGDLIATAPFTLIETEQTHIAAFDRLPRAHAGMCGSIVALQFAQPQTSGECHKRVTCFHCSFRRVRLLPSPAEGPSIASIVSIAINTVIAHSFMSMVTVVAVAYLRTIGSRLKADLRRVTARVALMCGCSPATASLVTLL